MQAAPKTVWRADGHAIVHRIDMHPVEPGAVARVLAGLNLE
jgi:hypothetical protein